MAASVEVLNGSGERLRVSRRPSDRGLFLAAGVLFPLLVLVGYARTYYLGSLFGAKPLANTLVHAHGLVMSAWVIYFVAQQFQFVFGYSPFETGVRLLPLAVSVSIGAALSGRATPRLGGRVVVGAGLAVGALGVLSLTFLDAASGYGLFFFALQTTMTGFTAVAEDVCRQSGL